VSILIDPHDSRGARAIRLATQAMIAGWPRLNAYWMPSSRAVGKVYLATRVSCECPDFRYRGRIRRCFHSLAVELLDELANEKAAF
jgi:hypothetical protein